MKKIVIVIFGVTLLLTLFGCGKKENVFTCIDENTGGLEAEALVYNIPEKEMLIRMEAGSDLCVIVTVNHQKESTSLYTNDMKSEVCKKIPFDFENRKFSMVEMDQNNNIYLLLKNENNFELLKMDISGTILYQTQINTSEMINGMVVNNNGTVCISVKNELYICNSIENENSVVKIDDQVLDLVMGKNEKVILKKINETGINLASFDLETRKIDKEVSCPDDIDIQGLMESKYSDFCIYNQDGVWDADFEEQKLVHSINFNDSGYSGSSLEGGVELDKNSFLFRNFNTGKRDVPTEVLLFSKTNQSDSRNEIVLAGVNVSTIISLAVSDYNRKNKENMISIVDYGEYEEEAVHKLTTDILAGKEFDILCLNGLDTQNLITNEVLIDLNQYFINDNTIKKDDILSNVITSIEKNNKIYYVSPGFCIETAIGQAETVGEKEITLDSMLEITRKNEDKTSAISNLSRNEVLLKLIKIQLSSDPDGSSILNKEYLKKYLEFGGSLPVDAPCKTFGEYVDSEKVLTEVQCIDFNDFLIYNRAFGKNVSFVGMPVEYGGGNRINFLGMEMGIFSKSDNQEVAWDFLKNTLTEDFQFLNCYPNFFPTNKVCMEKIIDSISIKNAYEDISGNWIEPYACEAMYDDFEIVVTPMEDFEEEKFWELLKNSTIEYRYDDNLVTIINEEVISYQNDKISIDTVINNIINRSEIYLKEKDNFK